MSLPKPIITPDFNVFHKGAPPSDPKDLPGYDAGFQAGQAQAVLQYSDTVRVMEASLQALSDQLSQLLTEMESNIVSQISGAFDVIFDPLVDQIGPDFLQKTLDSFLGQTKRTELVIHCHEDDQTHIQGFLTAKFIDAKILAVPEQTRFSMALSWEGGGAACDLNGALDLLREQLSQFNLGDDQ